MSSQRSRRPFDIISIYNRLVISSLTLGAITVVLLQQPAKVRYLEVAIPILEVLLIVLFLGQLALSFLRELRGSLPGLLAGIIYSLLTLSLFAFGMLSRDRTYEVVAIGLIVLRSGFSTARVFARIRRFAEFIRRMSRRPALSVMASFAFAILIGTILLMFPFATTDNKGLGVIDALFTSTSAVCVTGLIVVDTATAFSFWGKLIILLLIQAGGLGIMILSFFVAFFSGRSLSVENKMLLSYMISENDMTRLKANIMNIIYITLSFEAAGALFLFWPFRGEGGPITGTAFLAIFHAVSAFCNAGFSLFSDSLLRFQSNFFVNTAFCLLIIAGGLSFAVLSNLMAHLKGRFGARAGKQYRRAKLTLNTKAVLLITAALIVAGVLVLYALEHGGALQPMGLKGQYTASFFQSVTLRTAGFNTIQISTLLTPTLVVMILFMFVGGAAGSTAGGIKINSLAIFFSYIGSLARDRRDITLFRHSISKDQVMRASFIFFFGVSSVLAGSFVLSIIEDTSFIRILFEATSAFGTVGLSTGITSSLTPMGRIIVVLLMFMGRIGPITLLAALTQRARRVQIEYPQGDILIG
jgi:trk system potassium uptake protein TrkH